MFNVARENNFGHRSEMFSFFYFIRLITLSLLFPFIFGCAEFRLRSPKKNMYLPIKYTNMHTQFTRFGFTRAFFCAPFSVDSMLLPQYISKVAFGPSSSSSSTATKAAAATTTCRTSFLDGVGFANVCLYGVLQLLRMLWRISTEKKWIEITFQIFLFSHHRHSLFRRFHFY